MKIMLLDRDKYYINQANYPNIKFKDGETERSVGCAVTCFATLICARLHITDNNARENIIKNIIVQDTNDSAWITWEPFYYKNIKFKLEKHNDILLKLLEHHCSIVQINNHFVVVMGFDSTKKGFDRYIVFDVGNQENISLTQSMADHNSQNVILSKRYLI